MPKTDPDRILIVDDEISICEVLSIALKKVGYQVQFETDPRRALERIRQDPFDVVIQDLQMPGMDGIDLLREIKKVREETLVIILTAYGTWDRAVEAMRLGAYDYIHKPFDTQLDIKATVSRALQIRRQKKETGVTLDDTFREIGLVVGYSKGMKLVRDLIERAAPTDSTVLIQGESGVGKELVARALHYGSGRADKPFIPVNCGALTETLLESELFGHAKGAFTGAFADKIGLVEVANQGTLFLDEISDMSPHLQVKVLRLIEEKEFRPVGSVTTRKVDVRFITATNKILDQEVRSGTFRKDLYYRLNVIPITVPPLRDRRDDIPLLSEHFLQRYTREMGKAGKDFTERAKEAMVEFGWAGNIRELENAVQRAVALSDSDEIGPSNLFDQGVPVPEAKGTGRFRPIGEDGIDLDRELAEIEIGYLRRALEVSGGSYTRAGQLLGLSLRSFRYKIQKYGLDKGR